MQDTLRQVISDALVNLEFPAVDFVVDYPTDKNAVADYFSNVALVLSAQVGKPPREIAAQIATAVTGKINQVASIEVAGPGFLNVAMEREFFTWSTANVLAAGDTWGSHDTWKDKVVIVEYTDPNPFKELHIGHIVPNALGESLARLFMLAGADTKRVTFQGDVGMHVAKAMYGLKQ
jgi:arginyl-tRNA synthetase